MLAVALGSVAAPASAATITKSPDLGPYWHQLGEGSNFIFANSFVATISGPVTDIGIWLINSAGDTSAQPIAFNVFGSTDGRPDGENILATTGPMILDVTNTLSLFDEKVTSSADLTLGDTYFVAADVLGLSGGGELQVGGHTQNSEGILDNGTSWNSYDPQGITFQNGVAPEMAFTVTLSPGAVPEPETWTMMALGFAGLGFMGWRGSRRIVGHAA
jgi:hypothetical protein